MLKPSAVACLAILFALFLSLPLRAQLDTGTILGTVTDASGAVVPGANVEVQNQNTGLTQLAVTGSVGDYVVPGLPIGRYRVTVSLHGFKTRVIENLTLRVSDRLRADASLETGQLSEKVTVTGETPLVDTASTTLGGVVNSQQVHDLPLNGRSVTELIGLVPGVMLRGGANQQSVGGQGTFTNTGGLHFLVDGGDASRIDFDDLNNTYGASAGRISRASVDSIEEFRVYTDSYSAEFGQTQGGVVNLITKSGTNELHGSLFEYFRNEKLDARDYFNAAPAYKPAYRLNQFGGTLAGPIVRNRLFYFANYEGVRQRTGNVLIASVPTEAFRNTMAAPVRDAVSVLPLPNQGVSTADPRVGIYNKAVSDPLDENTGMIKVDYDITSSDHLSGRLNVNENLTQHFFGVARGQIQTAPGRMYLAKLSETHTFSPRLLNEFGFNFNRFHVDPRAASEEDVLRSPIVNFGGGIANVGPNLFDLRVANNSYSTLDTLTWIAGRHQLRFGTQIIRNQGNKELGLQQLVNYLNLDDAAANQAFSLTTIGFPRVGLRNTYAHFFVQDDFRVNTHLTLNMGVRYQYDTAPTEAHGRIANFDLTTGKLDPVGSTILDAPKLNFAPRFGIAYSPFASGNTVIRGGYGIFFADLNAANLGQNMPSNTPGFQFNASVNAFQVLGLAGLPFPDLTQFALPTTSFTAIAKNFPMAYTQKWNVNVQQALSRNTLLQVEYMGSRSLHLQGTINENRLIAGTQTRPIPGVGDVTFMLPGLVGNYEALMTVFRQRFGHGITFNLNYTFSHSLDDQPTIFGSFQDDHNFVNDYGSSDFDVRHNLEFDYTYAIPKAPVLPGWLVSGWQINGITNIRSGFPYSVSCGCDPVGVGQATSRADLVPGVSVKPANYSIPLNQLNFAAFAAPLGHYGTLGRNTFYGPGAVNFDFSLFKTFTFRERHNVQFRAEMFNVFNHPQFGNPVTSLTAPSLFGASLATITTPEGFHTSRQVQFALRYSF